MTPLKQENRILAIKTALGADQVAVREIRVSEQLSRLFQIEAELSSQDGEIDFNKVMGHGASIRLKLARNGKRFFHGVVNRFVQTADEDGYAHYRATIVPWLWFLTRTSDCRIYQEKKVSEIIEDVFQRHGFSDYRLSLSGTYEKKEFCVQYRETDFNFVSRLMEQEGIYYFFEHEETKHTLVLADSISAHHAAEGYKEIVFQGLDAGGMDREVITDWTIETEVQPGAYALRDFDFKKPKTVLESATSVTRSHGEAEHEIYDYPGEFVQHDEGTRLADVRLAELQAQHEVLRGDTTARGIASGSTFALKKHPRANQNREYLIVSNSLRVDAGEFSSAAPTDTAFSCEFTAIDSQTVFRSPRTTPKPIVQGPQTAIVVGPAGEEIHTDEHARVKVHFHWDRHGDFDENASCWIRVSQSNAGKGWGSMITPRIGQEVIVEFLEGDPDRPIITGRVYNADQKAPYAGGSGVVSGLKSQTHKGAGSNEMSMEDTAGKEKLTINGQYDMNTAVGNNQTNKVGVDQTENVGSNRTVEIGANDKLSVGGNRDTSITGNNTTSITGNNQLTVSGKEDHSISGKSSLQVGSSRTEMIATSHTIMNLAMTVGVGTKYALSAGSSLTEVSPKVLINAGSKLQAISGGPLDVKAAAKLTQQSGAAMNIKAGAALKAQSGAAMSLKSGAGMNAQSSAAMNLKAGGTLTQKGSSIKLNSPTKIKGTTLTVA